MATNINGEIVEDPPNPFSNGMQTYHRKYPFCLDLVPIVPGINTVNGPHAGDTGKISIIINNTDAGNVFAFELTQIILEVI